MNLEVEVEWGNTEVPQNFDCLGYEVTGKVVSQQENEPINGVDFLLYPVSTDTTKLNCPALELQDVPTLGSNFFLPNCYGIIPLK